MKVFISWSGQISLEVAKTLRDWIPSVIQIINPYVSSEDIDKGTRWSTDIAEELEESSFGILCITAENVDAAWLNFEAGALSKSIDKSRVCPFLFGIKRSEVHGPLLQFQSTIGDDREDVLKLIGSLNSSCGERNIEKIRLQEAFDVWWPKLQEALDSIPIEGANTDEEENMIGPTIDSLLEEILEVTRTNQRFLSDPSILLPDEYIRETLGRSQEYSKIKTIDPKYFEMFIDMYCGLCEELMLLFSGFEDKEQFLNPLESLNDCGYTFSRSQRH